MRTGHAGSLRLWPQSAVTELQVHPPRASPTLRFSLCPLQPHGFVTPGPGSRQVLSEEQELFLGSPWQLRRSDLRKDCNFEKNPFRFSGYSLSPSFKQLKWQRPFSATTLSLQRLAKGFHGCYQGPSEWTLGKNFQPHLCSKKWTKLPVVHRRGTRKDLVWVT